MATTPPLPEGTVHVDEAGGGRLVRNIQAGPHYLVGDEPQSMGGTGKGPNPYDLLLASFGSCTSMTLRLYAERKGWPLERVTVTLSHEKIHAKDCAECESVEGKVDRIERAIQLQGELTDDQRGRLMEIADMCPICRTLKAEINIRSTLIP